MVQVPLPPQQNQMNEGGEPEFEGGDDKPSGIRGMISKFTKKKEEEEPEPDVEPPEITEMERIVYIYHIVVYNLDLFTDLLYYLTVPFFKDIMAISVVLCSFLPLIIQEINIRNNINPGGGCWKNCKCCGCPSCESIQNAGKHLVGMAPMMYRKNSQKKLLKLWLEESVFAGIPVFILQMTNSLLLG